jgi:hypothetical protein
LLSTGFSREPQCRQQLTRAKLQASMHQATCHIVNAKLQNSTITDARLFFPRHHQPILSHRNIVSEEMLRDYARASRRLDKNSIETEGIAETVSSDHLAWNTPASGMFRANHHALDQAFRRRGLIQERNKHQRYAQQHKLKRFRPGVGRCNVRSRGWR